MNWIDKLERRFGRWAIPNLMVYLIIFYVVGYVINLTNSSFYSLYLSLDIPAVLHGQIWRLLTFLLYPPTTDPLWMILLSFIYYSIGRSMEQILGAFRFGLFIWMGVIGCILSAFLIYAIWGGRVIGTVKADYLYLSMLLAMAITFPDMKFYLYFVLPVKAKWLTWFYLVMLGYEFYTAGWPARIVMAMSLLNVLIYYLMLRRPFHSAKQTGRKIIYQNKARPAAGPRHRCAVCGRTELDDPNLEFRYCSKCDGNLEYCSDHLYTHKHVTRGHENNEEN